MDLVPLLLILMGAALFIVAAVNPERLGLSFRGATVGFASCSLVDNG